MSRMPMTDADLDAWSVAYIEGVQDPVRFNETHPNWWAVERFMNSETNGDDIWRAILNILARSPPDEVLAVLAAGPLEDLIHYRGDAFIDRIERHARQDPAFRKLLGGVWQSGSEEVWARVERACVRLEA
jgi:hypothetical protein